MLKLTAYSLGDDYYSSHDSNLLICRDFVAKYYPKAKKRKIQLEFSNKKFKNSRKFQLSFFKYTPLSYDLKWSKTTKTRGGVYVGLMHSLVHEFFKKDITKKRILSIKPVHLCISNFKSTTKKQ